MPSAMVQGDTRRTGPRLSLRGVEQQFPILVLGNLPPKPLRQQPQCFPGAGATVLLPHSARPELAIPFTDAYPIGQVQDRYG